MTQERIKAYKTCMLYSGHTTGTDVYIINQSDIRALAEQMAEEHVDCWNRSSDPYRSTVKIMLRVLKRHGMTPGRKGGAK